MHQDSERDQPVRYLPEQAAEWRREMRRRNTAFAWWMALSVAVLAALSPWTAVDTLRFGSAAVIEIGWLYAVYQVVRSGRRQYSALAESLESDERSHIGLWIDVVNPGRMGMYFPGRENHPSLSRELRGAREKLLQYLPTLRDCDGALLSPGQRRNLYGILRGGDLRLIAAILEALPHIGTAEAIPTVARLAAGEGAAAGNLDIRASAQECLAMLEEHAAARALLRPSEGQHIPLVRPAEPTDATANERLLRPGG